MELLQYVPSSKLYFLNLGISTKTHITSISCSNCPISQISSYNSFLNQTTPRTHSISLYRINNCFPYERVDSRTEAIIPTMPEIMKSSRAQNLELHLQTVGPFFRIKAKKLETQTELGRAEGMIRVWLGGRILHLDSIRLRKETLGMERSIFGIGLFIGAVAIRYGYDCGCKTAELLAINDSELYHSKLIRFYTRIGFKAVHEVTGSSMGDLVHMLVWGGIGTRMDANIEELLVRWCSRFISRN